MMPLTGHLGAVTSLTFSPDSKTLASTSKDGTVRLWEGSDEVRQARVGSLAPLCAAFDAEGRELFVGAEDGSVSAWPLLGDFKPRVMTAVAGTAVTGVRLMPGGLVLAFATGKRGEARPGGVHFTPLDGKKATPATVRDAGGVWCLADHPGKRLLAWGTGNRELHVRDMSRQDPIAFRLKHNVPAVAVAPDGQSVAAAVDWAVRVFDVAKKAERLTLSGHKGLVNAVAYTPDGRLLLSGGSDRAVRVWDVATGREAVALTFPVGRVTALAVAPDGLSAAAGDDEGTVLLWDLDAYP